jgi:hypothetical protein
MKCDQKAYTFQEALTFLDTDSKFFHLSNLENNAQYDTRKKLDEEFLKDCKGLVDRCLICLKRKERIPGYKYSI